jgi:GTP cyclohydrolase I
MSTEHTVAIKATCPVDNTTVDEYVCTVAPPHGTLVYAEAITTAVDLLTRTPITQEHLTQKLANLLHSEVTTRGWHAGRRVETRCFCRPARPARVSPQDVVLAFSRGQA